MAGLEGLWAEYLPILIFFAIAGGLAVVAVGASFLAAGPLFSANIGLKYALADGLANAHSEYTTPAGGEPTNEL